MPREWEAARVRCAQRTRDELAEMSFSRDPSEREVGRLGWMEQRCGTCRACPLTLRALRVMLPAKPEPQSAEVLEFRLAG